MNKHQEGTDKYVYEYDPFPLNERSHWLIELVEMVVIMVLVFVVGVMILSYKISNAFHSLIRLFQKEKEEVSS